MGCYGIAGSYDKCVHALRERYKDDITNILGTLLSHAQVAKKNQVSWTH